MADESKVDETGVEPSAPQNAFAKAVELARMNPGIRLATDPLVIQPREEGVDPTGSPIDLAAGMVGGAMMPSAAIETEQMAAKAMRGLPKSSPGPNAQIQKLANEYTQESGLPLRRAAEYVKADPARGARIAQAYEQMPHNPSDPAVKKSYDALIDETLGQYQKVKQLGLNVEPIQAGMANPYPKGSAQVAEDIKKGHLWYYPTEQGFGSGEIADHPLLQMTDETINGKPMPANDVFRIVHDVFGHAKEGTGFGPHGEENAWQAHFRMYSPEAQKAMTTETRGQNSWVNFGPKGAANQANPGQTQYAEQKAGILPDWAHSEGLAADEPGKNLSHYSRSSEPLQSIDPEFHGQGAIGKEDMRPGRVPRSYYYEEATKPEEMVESGAKTHYTVSRPEKILDFASPEAESIRKQAEQLANWPDDVPTHMERLAKEAGYHGFKNTAGPQPGSVGLFHAQKPMTSKKIGYAEGGAIQAPQYVAPPVQPLEPPAEGTPEAAGMPIYQISGEKPILGTVAHEEVQPSVMSGNYSLPKGVQVPVFDADGQLGTVDAAEAPEAFRNGYRYATPQDLSQHKYGGEIGQQLKAAMEGVAQGAIGPAAPLIETGLGLATPEAIRKRAEFNPWIHGGGEAAGLVGTSLLGVGEGALLGKAGEAGAAALGLRAAEEGVANKIGSAAVKGAIENMVFQGSDETSKMVLGDPQQTIGSAMADVGLAGVIGGTIGAGLGAVSPLWKATSESKMGEMLKAITNKVGGVEGGDISPIQKAIQESGMSIAPEVRAAMSDNPILNEWSSSLSQTDTNHSGRAFQASLEKFGKEASQAQVAAFGKTMDEVLSKGEINKYDIGKSIGDSLADEYSSKVDPLVEQYQKYQNQFKGADLAPSITEKAPLISNAQEKMMKAISKGQKALAKALKSGNPEASIDAQARLNETQNGLKALQDSAKEPGTIDLLQDRLTSLAQREGWLTSPSSDIMREVGRVQKELPNLKTLKDLTEYIKQVGQNTQSKLPFGQQDAVSRAGGLMKSILRKAEGEVLGSHIGSEEGEQALEAYRATQKQYASVAQIKDAIDDRLHAHGSVAGYAKSIKGMASQEAEKLLNRIGTGKDADLLNLLKKEFPQTAARVRDYHIDSLLASAKDGDRISSKKLIKALENMSPQMREFAVGHEAEARVRVVNKLLEQLEDKTHNFSNTARTTWKLVQDLPGTAVGFLGTLISHNPITGALLGGLTKVLGKDVPDAAKLALLKYLGSPSEVSASGFKSAVDVIHAAMKGQQVIARGAKNVLVAGKEVLPENLIPSEGEKNRLDKMLKSIRDNPRELLPTAIPVGHYMPEHAQAMSQTAAQASNYINGQRPASSKQSPLDSDPPVSAEQKAQFNRTLAIAVQPATVLSRVKSGEITPKDVKDLQNIAPGAYQAMAKSLSDEMIKAVHKGQLIPYKTRIGLSIFLGQPMDSTMLPMNIIAAQPQPKQGMQQQPPNMGKPKKGTGALNKLPGAYKTPGQAAEEDRTRE